MMESGGKIEGERAKDVGNDENNEWKWEGILRIMRIVLSDSRDDCILNDEEEDDDDENDLWNKTYFYSINITFIHQKRWNKLS
jgi:hypothetical protein